MTEQELYQEIHRRLDYNPETGVFTWKVSQSNRVKIGMKAGYLGRKGYRDICFSGKNYALHRLAWLYVYGNFPNGDLDHVNCVKTDNRICNLRIATAQQNNRNASVYRNNTLGIKGVSRIGKRYRARIVVNKKERHLGYFETPEAAAAAFRKAAMEVDPVFYRVD